MYLGNEVHLLGLLSWVLDQTGPAEVIVTTFSTSDDFLCGFLRLKDDGLIASSYLVADFKASRKTLTLGALMQQCFDHVCFSMNHSKLMLVSGGGYHVAVITSQNQTYGGRVESTLIANDARLWHQCRDSVMDLIDNHSTPYKEWIKN